MDMLSIRWFSIDIQQMSSDTYVSELFKLGYKDSNLEMLESESSALPFGDSPSYVLKYTTYNVLCKPFAQALVYYITLETKKQVFFLEYSTPS